MSPLSKTATSTFEQQTADVIRTLLTWCAVLSVAFVVALGLSIYGLVRVGNDEARTCQIQSRGLPVGHEQAAINSDIYRLLTLKPRTAAERRQAAEVSPAVRAVVIDLTVHLAHYRMAEATQPHTRIC